MRRVDLGRLRESERPISDPLPNPPAQLGGFKTEDEAREWIKRKSIAWLKEFEGGKYA